MDETNRKGKDIMLRLKQLRMALMSFGVGLLLGNIDSGLKVCIITPLIILWFMSYDFKSERRTEA